MPYLITCPIEFTNKIPVSISLTAKTCDNAENKLQIINNQPLNGIKKSFGVCSKFLEFDNRSYVIRFIEWVLMMRILGADKITIYNRHVHPELYKIMNYFVEKGFLDFYEFLEPSGVANSHFSTFQFQMLEVLQHTDCFYRTRNLYKYIAVMDTDEVIVPTEPEDYSWHDLVKRFDLTKRIVSFIPRNVIMPNLKKPLHAEIPDYHYILQHTQVILIYVSTF